MTMSLSSVRDALQTRLETIANLRGYDTIPGDPRLPAAIVSPGDPYVSYDLTFGGGTTINFIVRLVVSRASEKRAQDKLDVLVSDGGAGSVYAAIEASPTLGGTVDSTRIIRARNFGTAAYGGVDYLVIDLDIECLTS